MEKKTKQSSNVKPYCIKCVNYTDSKCKIYGEIPKAYLNIEQEVCQNLKIALDRAFLDVGNRPLTMVERWAMDEADNI